jgi:hypothetical protein
VLVVVAVAEMDKKVFMETPMGTPQMLEQARLEREGYENYPGRFQPNAASRAPMYLQPMFEMAGHQPRAPRPLPLRPQPPYIVQQRVGGEQGYPSMPVNPPIEVVPVYQTNNSAVPITFMPSAHPYRLPPYASANTMPMVNQRIDQPYNAGSFGSPNEQPHMGGLVSTPKSGMGQPGGGMMSANVPVYQRGGGIHNNAFYNNSNIITASIDYRSNFLEENLRLLREGVRRYLADPSQESVVIIQYACVAQKSYGNEKR